MDAIVGSTQLCGERHNQTRPINCLFLFAASGLFYQAAVVPFYAKADSALQPAELIDDVVKNELTDRTQQHRWMYTIERRQGDQALTKEQVETQYGPLDRLVAIDGVPLNA